MYIEQLKDASGKAEDMYVECEASWDVRRFLEAWLEPEEELQWEQQPAAGCIAICVNEDL